MFKTSSVHPIQSVCRCDHGEGAQLQVFGRALLVPFKECDGKGVGGGSGAAIFSCCKHIQSPDSHSIYFYLKSNS